MKNSNTTTTGNSIMDFNFNQLTSACLNFLSRIDDYQQMCEDHRKNEMTQFFVDSYNQLEAIIFDLQPEELTDEVRNSIRSLMKETEKMACVQFFA